MDEYLYTKALKFLARRPHSEKEVHDNLFKKYLLKKLDPEQKQEIENKISIIISKLREQKFVNDEEFAKWWIEQRTKFKTMGESAIEFELKAKGISTEIIKVLRSKYQVLRGKSEKELAMELVQRRIKKYQGLSRQELYTKLGGFLARRGFGLDVIKTCIDEILGK